MRPLCLLPLVTTASAALFVSFLQAQVSSVTPRVAAPVDESALTTLKGNITPLARAEYDRGEADPGRELRNMRLVLSRSAEQTAALNKLMGEQLDKSSTNYHKWLTPEQFGKLFGPADSDIAAVVAWLQAHGFKVEEVSSGRTNIAFSGTVRQVEQAFHTPIHSFDAMGRRFYSNTGNPRIPSVLAPVVSGVAHLNTLEPRPHLAASRPGVFDPQAGHFASAPSENRLARPDLTTGGNFLWLTPSDAATIYDTPNTFNAAFSSSATAYTGFGVKIGIGGIAAVQPATVVNYRTRFLDGDNTSPIITNVDNSATLGDANLTNEAYIDLELSGGVAPGATIHFYTADNNDGGLETAINRALSDNDVDILSLSFGLCEHYMTTSDNSLINGMYQQAASQGIAVTVSTGDSGSAGCDDPSSETVASKGLQVNGWGSTPFNIAVGGTDFSGLLGGNFSTYVNNNQSAANFYRSAKSYIPESTWNDSPATDGLLADNVPVGLPSSTNIVGGGGGVSACSTNTDTNTGGNFVLGTCTSGYAKPSWQRGTGVPADNARDLPDVSLFAGNGFDSAAWLVCTDDLFGTTSYPEDCSDQTNGQFYFTGYGGTSTSAPAFAGMLALVQEMLGGNGHRLGADAAKTVYDLFNTSHAATVFHDTTVGNNSMYCTSGTPKCSLNTAGYQFLTGYDTTAGYDLATGMGAVDATQLVKFWGAGSGSVAATVSVTPSATQITTADSLSVAATVSGSASLGSPTGTATLSGGGYTSSAQTLDNTGAATFTVAAGALSIGTDTMTVTYSGDTNYASTTGTASVTVTGLTATVTVTPATNRISTVQSLAVTVTVTGAGATPTGTITLSGGGYTSSATAISGGSAAITIPAGGLAVGSDTLTASYSGDSTYASASGSSAPVTVFVIVTPTVTVTPASASIDTSQPLDVTVAVSGTGGIPSGSVTLSGGGYTSSAQTLDSTGKVTITIPANSLSAGNSVTLTATYAGDAMFASATGAATIAVTQSTFAVAASAPPAVNAGGSASSTITVSSSTSYAGSVTLACALTSSPAGAVHMPACSISGSPVTLSSTTTSATATASISTTAANTSNLQRRGVPGWTGAGGGAVLALVVFLGMPARRRSWRNLIGLLVLTAALGGFTACGSSHHVPGTTAGSYTFTVTATGTPAVTPAPTTTITLTVN